MARGYLPFVPAHLLIIVHTRDLSTPRILTKMTSHLVDNAFECEISHALCTAERRCINLELKNELKYAIFKEFSEFLLNEIVISLFQVISN